MGAGVAPDGAPIHVRGAPPGSRIRVLPQGRQKGVWQGRRLATIRPSPQAATPQCALFGLCGGCVLQELTLFGQRQAKASWALSEIVREFGVSEESLRERVNVHEIVGADSAYGYRNRVELSFGVRRYVSEKEKLEDASIEGKWLGFHAPGRFDRVVDAARCELVSEALNRVIEVVREAALTAESPPCWDAKNHTGFWRYLGLRESSTGEILVSLYTASPVGDAEDRVSSLANTILNQAGVVGVVWFVNDGVADVARGEVRGVWGRDHLFEQLGPVRYRLSPSSFFQTSTEGALRLYDVIGEATRGYHGELLDLYCGTGAIGLYLASVFARVFGIEEVESAVNDARANATANGILTTTYVHGKVEDQLAAMPEADGPRVIVLDPPRVGLHPKVAKSMAEAKADLLLYVACFPASLGRDAAILEAGGWRLTDLRFVDLFPQTGHVEAVGTFVRAPVD